MSPEIKSDWRHDAMRIFLLYALALLAYWPALHGKFIWDDITFITDNNLIHSPVGLWRIWFSKESTDYWPLTYSVFWFMWRIFGDNPLGYHLINIMVHATNALLIWKILALSYSGPCFLPSDVQP